MAGSSPPVFIEERTLKGHEDSVRDYAFRAARLRFFSRKARRMASPFRMTGHCRHQQVATRCSC